MKFRLYLQDIVERTLIVDVPIDKANSLQSVVDYLTERIGEDDLPKGEVQEASTIVKSVESAEE